MIDIDTNPSSSQSAESATASVKLTYDPEWLAITRAFHPYLSVVRKQSDMPHKTEAEALVKKELEWVLQNVGEEREISSQQVFWPTAPGPGSEGDAKYQQRELFYFSHYSNILYSSH